MALTNDDHKWLDSKFTIQNQQLEQTIARIVLDYKERDASLAAEISELKKSDKYQSLKLKEIDVKAEASGAFAGKKESVKWSLIIGLALNLAIKIAEIVKELF